MVVSEDPRVRLAAHDANAVPSLRRPQRAPETRVFISSESIPAVERKRRSGTTRRRVRRVARRVRVQALRLPTPRFPRHRETARARRRPSWGGGGAALLSERRGNVSMRRRSPSGAIDSIEFHDTPRAGLPAARTRSLRSTALGTRANPRGAATRPSRFAAGSTSRQFPPTRARAADVYDAHTALGALPRPPPEPPVPPRPRAPGSAVSRGSAAAARLLDDAHRLRDENAHQLAGHAVQFLSRGAVGAAVGVVTVLRGVVVVQPPLTKPFARRL